MKVGMQASYGDTENGMTMSDMQASLRTANALNEIIVFRSTGPWSKRWLENKPPFPSKNFHVKGKSSDWGPQAGFVPYDGTYSKVGYSSSKAKEGTKKNQDGIKDGFAGAEPLRLTREQLMRQRLVACESPPRTAIDNIIELPSGDLLLVCDRTGDNARFAFYAKRDGDGYLIMVMGGPVSSNWMLAVDRAKAGKLDTSGYTPLKVMVSEESGAGRRPMTGDYDLMAICPPFSDYMSVSTQDEFKPALVLNPSVNAHHAPKDAFFAKGSRMDKVMDMRLSTGGMISPKKGTALEEHGDMGNLTPRILRAINLLNVNMGAVGKNAALRRVHHNAESHRHSNFGALKAAEMEADGEGFPLTAFHPAPAIKHGSQLAKYGDVCTIERMNEFREYAADVQASGYYVPKNWTWAMSIRNTANKMFGGKALTGRS